MLLSPWYLTHGCLARKYSSGGFLVGVLVLHVFSCPSRLPCALANRELLCTFKLCSNCWQCPFSHSKSFLHIAKEPRKIELKTSG